jgi:hypothetical protein
VVSILGDPSEKLKSIDYYPVINTHITENKAHIGHLVTMVLVGYSDNID